MEILKKTPSLGLFSRRGFLTGVGATLVHTALAQHAFPRSASAQSLGDDPFTLGVASGDPTSDGVVLWTRLAPKPLEGGGMPNRPFVVRWVIASDEHMRRVVRRGASWAMPELGHSVHVEADGLDPSRWYWFQFKVGSEYSPIARAPRHRSARQRGCASRSSRASTTPRASTTRTGTWRRSRSILLFISATTSTRDRRRAP
jgi:phosphodiesterase/alkaline phosphatase D-like protein